MVAFEQDEKEIIKFCLLNFNIKGEFLCYQAKNNLGMKDFLISKTLIRVLGMENTQKNMFVFAQEMFVQMMFFVMFKKFAQVETKAISAETKSKKRDINRFTNRTKSTIIQLDCTWFTTAIKCEGFGVRTHLRLQPYKGEDGQKTYKFIIIDAYEKTGYTRKAKKLDEPISEEDLELENRLNIEENLKSE